MARDKPWHSVVEIAQCGIFIKFCSFINFITLSGFYFVFSCKTRVAEALGKARYTLGSCVTNKKNCCKMRAIHLDELFFKKRQTDNGFFCGRVLAFDKITRVLKSADSFSEILLRYTYNIMQKKRYVFISPLIFLTASNFEISNSYESKTGLAKKYYLVVLHRNARE